MESIQRGFDQGPESNPDWGDSPAAQAEAGIHNAMVALQRPSRGDRSIPRSSIFCGDKAEPSCSAKLAENT